MNFSPILFSASDSRLPAAWQGVGRAFSHVWQTIHQISSQLYQLILDIKNIVCKTFSFSFEQRPQSCVLPEKMGWQALQSRELLEELGFVPCAGKNRKNPAKTPINKANTPFSSESNPLKLLTKEALLNYLNSDSALEQNMDKTILADVCAVLRPVKNVLDKVSAKKLTVLQDYLDLIECLEKELVALKDYTSHFKEFSEAHQLVQLSLKLLEDKTRAIEKSMCQYIRGRYKPNYKIRGDGHCLFSSIQSQQGSQEEQKYFRKLAADYIAAHPQEFESAFEDVIRTPGQAKDKIIAYALAQGGGRLWREKLKKDLGREPMRIDLYCDCLANSAIWGGVNELSALSEALKVPILVFTRQDSTQWRIDVIKGTSKFKDCDPILLYYNGNDHYQNLILK